MFFTFNNRGPEEGKNIDILSLVEDAFSFIYQSPKSNKLFSRPQTYQENSILNNLANQSPISTKPQNERTCDEVFYEYLNIFQTKTNQKFLLLMTKFVLLFRECYDVSKNKNLKEEDKKAITNVLTPEGLPDLCNEFYGEFLEPNDFLEFMIHMKKTKLLK